MKHQSARTMVFTALVLASGGRGVGGWRSQMLERLLAGTWGYTKTGTKSTFPTGAALFASIGTLTFDAAGNVTERWTASLGHHRQQRVAGDFHNEFQLQRHDGVSASTISRETCFARSHGSCAR